MLVSKVDMEDVVAAIITGAIGAGTAALLDHNGAQEFDARISWLAKAKSIPMQILRDTITVALAFFNRVAGKSSRAGYREIEFDTGGDDPESRARRGVVTVYTSLSPNAYLVGIEHGKIRIHQLVVGSRPPSNPDDFDRRWPI